MRAPARFALFYCAGLLTLASTFACPTRDDSCRVGCTDCRWIDVSRYDATLGCWVDDEVCDVPQGIPDVVVYAEEDGDCWQINGSAPSSWTYGDRRCAPDDTPHCSEVDAEDVSCRDGCDDCRILRGRMFDVDNGCWSERDVCDVGLNAPGIAVSAVDGDGNCWMFAGGPPTSFTQSWQEPCAPTHAYEGGTLCTDIGDGCSETCEACATTTTYVFDDDNNCWASEDVCDTYTPHPDADPPACIADDGECRKYVGRTPNSALPICRTPEESCGQHDAPSCE